MFHNEIDVEVTTSLTKLIQISESEKDNDDST